MEKISLDLSTPGILLVKLSGEWMITAKLPDVNIVISELTHDRNIKQVDFDASHVSKWDSGLVSFLFHLNKECRQRNILFSLERLPEGVKKFLSLASKVNEKSAVKALPQEPFLERAGGKALSFINSLATLLDFLGEIAVSFGRFFSGKAFFRKDEFVAIVQKCGIDALPLVSLISVLVGIILAFIGAIQLKMFGAQIFIADIVGIGMVRVMGAVMTGVLMSGRTGASFAAELGIMQNNEEIDALKTLGLSPVEFLVMPRVLALVIMMPLLTLYADFMGILGGFFISTGILGLNPVEYWHHTQSAVKLSNLWVGLIHGFVFGIIIAVAGCLRGINCGRSSEAVGEATTSAVVQSIISIVIATAIITFICQVLGV